jgi:hypothetical protein
VVGFHPGIPSDDSRGGLSEDRHRGRLSGSSPVHLNDRSKCREV